MEPTTPSTGTQTGVPPMPPSAASSGDTYSYKGWLISDSFWKRALAIVGYNFVGTLILYAPLLVISMVFGFSMLAMLGPSEGGPHNDDGYGYGEMMNESDDGDLEEMCRDSLAYTTLPEGMDEAAYLADCMSTTSGDDSDMPMRNRYR